MAVSALSRYEIELTMEIFKNDEDFQSVVVNSGTIPLVWNESMQQNNLSNEQYRSLSETLLNEKSHISDYTVDELNAEDPPFLRNEISLIYNVSYIEKAVYYQTMYTFKYSTIKTFFRSNYDRFLPEYEYLNIISSEKKRIYLEAFMKELDRFANIIDEIYNVQDVDKTPEEYLNYLGQLVGYEREDYNLLANAPFRELIKNIVEIYRIKGTNYSYELFFNFIGFDVTIKEYWFDKRFADDGILANPETGYSDKKYAQFYFTSKKPTDQIPTGMHKPYLVSDNKITETMDCNEFTRLTLSGTYTYKQLVGDSSGYEGTRYTFFKTNVIQFNLQRTATGESGSELSAEDLASIKRYANFLTPIFIAKSISVIIKPFEDTGEPLVLSDDDRHDPREENKIPSNNLIYTIWQPDTEYVYGANVYYFYNYYTCNFSHTSGTSFNDDITKWNLIEWTIDETMLHLYEGKQPIRYYWEDGVRTYGEDNTPRPDTDRRYEYPTYQNWENIGETYWQLNPPNNYVKRTQVAPGGHFVSGYHTDTYQKIYDRTPGCGSVYDQITDAYPLMTDQEVLDEISRLLSLGTLFTTYPYYNGSTIKERDLIYPINDMDVSTPNKLFYLKDDFSIGTPITFYSNFSNIRGAKKRRSEALNRNFDNKVKIKSIDADNGSGRAVIQVYDLKKRYAYLNYSTFTVTGDVVSGESAIHGLSSIDIAKIDLDDEIINPSYLDGFKIKVKTPTHVYMDTVSPTTASSVTITLIEEGGHDHVDIFDAKDYRNDRTGLPVISCSHDNVTNITTITLGTTLSVDQQFEGGFIQLYHPEWIYYDFRFNFLFDRVIDFELNYSPITIGSEQFAWLTGDDASFYTEPILYSTWASSEVYSIGDIVFYFNRYYECLTGHTSGSTFDADASKWKPLNYTLIVGPPYPFVTPGTNYSEWPHGPSQDHLDDLYLNPNDMMLYYLTNYSIDSMQQDWNYFKFGETGLLIAGLYEEGVGIRSSFKALEEEPYYYYDYIDMEIG
jgi:hypothetical protein